MIRSPLENSKVGHEIEKCLRLDLKGPTKYLTQRYSSHYCESQNPALLALNYSKFKFSDFELV